jgi:hypothetical protein
MGEAAGVDAAVAWAAGFFSASEEQATNAQASAAKDRRRTVFMA